MSLSDTLMDEQRAEQYEREQRSRLYREQQERERENKTRLVTCEVLTFLGISHTEAPYLSNGKSWVHADDLLFRAVQVTVGHYTHRVELLFIRACGCAQSPMSIILPHDVWEWGVKGFLSGPNDYRQKIGFALKRTPHQCTVSPYDASLT